MGRLGIFRSEKTTEMIVIVRIYRTPRDFELCILRTDELYSKEAVYERLLLAARVQFMEEISKHLPSRTSEQMLNFWSDISGSVSSCWSFLADRMNDFWTLSISPCPRRRSRNKKTTNHSLFDKATYLTIRSDQIKCIGASDDWNRLANLAPLNNQRETLSRWRTMIFWTEDRRRDPRHVHSPSRAAADWTPWRGDGQSLTLQRIRSHDDNRKQWYASDWTCQSSSPTE